jgi:hypothetical protein
MSAGHEDRDIDGPFDMSARDQVKLSSMERQKLAHLEARMRLEDPAFATRMRGRSMRWVRHTVSGAHFPAMAAWLGPVLLIAGLVATLVVIDVFAWLSILTIGVAVVGAYRVALSLAAKAEHTRGPGHGRSDITQ